MPGAQTQHKGTVYGDDENAPETGTRPAGAPRRPKAKHAHRRTSRSHPPRGMTAPRAPDRRDGVRMRGAPFTLTQLSLEDLTQEVVHSRRREVSLTRGVRATLPASPENGADPPRNHVFLMYRHLF